MTADALARVPIETTNEHVVRDGPDAERIWNEAVSVKPSPKRGKPNHPFIGDRGNAHAGIASNDRR